MLVASSFYINCIYWIFLFLDKASSVIIITAQSARKVKYADNISAKE